MSDNTTILEVLISLTMAVTAALGGVQVNHSWVNPHLVKKCTTLLQSVQERLTTAMRHGARSNEHIQSLQGAIVIATEALETWENEVLTHETHYPWSSAIVDLRKAIRELKRQLKRYEAHQISLAESAGTEQIPSSNRPREPQNEHRERIASTRHVEPFTAQDPFRDGPTVPQHAHLPDDNLSYPTKARQPGLLQTLMHGHRGQMAMNQNPSWNDAGDLEAQEQDIGHSYPPSASPIVPRPPSRRHAMGKAARDMQSQGLSTPDNRHGTTLQMPPSQARYDPRMAPNTGGTHYQDPFANPGPPQYSTNNLGPGMVPTTHNDRSAAGPSTAGSGWHGNAQRHTYLPPYSETGQPSLPGDGSASQFPQSPTNISRNSGSTQQRWGSQEYDRVDSVFNDYHNPDH